MDEKKSFFLDKYEAERLSEADLAKISGGRTKPCLDCGSLDPLYGIANCPNSCIWKYNG